METVERRSELLRMEGLGLSVNEIVKELSVKAQVSERTVYKDFENRSFWQPTVQQYEGLERTYHKNLNRLEQIYRKASHVYLNADNDNAKVGALRLMLEIVTRLNEIHVLPNILNRLKDLEEKAKKGVFVE